MQIKRDTPSTTTPAGAPTKPDAPVGRSRQEIALREAWAAREYVIPVCLSSILDTRTVGADGAKVFLNSYLRDAGNPTDPIEIMLLEQFAMAHFRLGQLHIQADVATDAERLKILNAVAVRLLGELRRLALAIRLYRTPVSPKQFAVVHQQNVAAGLSACSSNSSAARQRQSGLRNGSMRRNSARDIRDLRVFVICILHFQFPINAPRRRCQGRLRIRDFQGRRRFLRRTRSPGHKVDHTSRPHRRSMDCQKQIWQYGRVHIQGVRWSQVLPPDRALSARPAEYIY
jgi:hypothetical protein